MQGFKYIHRKITDWEWYTHPTVSRLFIHCLLKANHTEKQWQGITIKAGQFATSYPILASELGLSIKQIRGAMEKLIKTGSVAHKGQSKYSVITVVNWEEYTTNYEKGHADGQSKGRQRAATNNDNKNNNKDKNNIYAPLFESFWSAYPLKKSKKKASQLFDQAVKSGVAAEKIIQAATNYANAPDREQAYTKHPTTWLGQGCWDDEYTKPAQDPKRRMPSPAGG